MLIRLSDWNAVREQFDEADKIVLNDAITGETICPRGVVIDEKIAGEVGRKLKRLIHERRQHGNARIP